MRKLNTLKITGQFALVWAAALSTELKALAGTHQETSIEFATLTENPLEAVTIPKLDLKGAPLLDLTNLIANEISLNLIYDSSQINNSYVTIYSENSDAEFLLRNLLRANGLDYVTSGSISKLVESSEKVAGRELTQDDIQYVILPPVSLKDAPLIEVMALMLRQSGINFVATGSSWVELNNLKVSLSLQNANLRDVIVSLIANLPSKFSRTFVNNTLFVY